MERINIKQEVISISDDDEINIKKEPNVGYTIESKGPSCISIKLTLVWPFENIFC